VQELCNHQPPPGKYDLFVTEGATAAICYIFNSLLENKILYKHDKIAIATPIFTPYLEIPDLNSFRFIALEVEAWEAFDWQIPEAELDKLADPEIKVCNVFNQFIQEIKQQSMILISEAELLTQLRQSGFKFKKNYKEYIMSLQNRSKATAKNIEGKVQEAVGDLTGDPQAQAEGQKKQAEASIRHTVEDVKDQVKRMID
jgi:uncharacterized protein YjbJ (UPF0337 family)